MKRLLLIMLSPALAAQAVADQTPAEFIRENYVKHEYRIPMRDGVQLFTAVYSPKNNSRPYPILLQRSPYDVGPYGEESYPATLGPHMAFAEEGYIFAYQDVRGKFMSEGEFVNMRPHLEVKSNPQQIDESSDTWDTVDWLVENVENNNGRVGMWGISYRGFYAAAGMIDAHPALVAVSPQAPIADWFFEDFHHHGAFCLSAAVNFFAAFGQPRPEPTTQWPPRLDHGTPDGYAFFLRLDPLRSVNDKLFHGQVSFWNEAAAHPNYDAFWQSRNILPHLHAVPPAVMTVGGWFDAENLYGALKIYESAEEKNPDVFNILVMGPWFHGGWTRSAGDRLGNISFGAATSKFYKEEVDLRFFNHFLKGEGKNDFPEALVFETGANRWRRFDEWPPAGIQPRSLHLRAGGSLAAQAPPAGEDPFAEYISDPANPVPYSETISTGITREYMTDDQRFASRRPDVLAFQTEVLTEDVTMAGPLSAELWVSTSNTAADWVVKVIDVFPDDAKAPDEMDPPSTRPWGGYQMMVRSEAFRGRFRNGYEQPEPFVPDEPARVVIPLQDVLHTFKAGHRIMVQVQSTWFPFIDRNPQEYVENIFEADASDYVPARHRVHHDPEHPSRLVFGASGPAEE